MRKGGISVFLTAILSVFLTLVSAAVEAVRFYAVKTESECAVSMGLDAAFAEYNRQLLEKYDLFFIDTSYGRRQPDYHNTEAHIWKYIQANLSADGISAHGAKDFLSMNLEGVTVMTAALATDDHGKDVKYQALQYMQERIGAEFVQDLLYQYDVVTGNGLDTDNVEAELDAVRAQIDAMPPPKTMLEDGSFETVELDNPADGVNRYRFHGILDLVIRNPLDISMRSIDCDNYVSHRRLNSGTGAASAGESFSAADEILFGEYLMEKCGNYRNVASGGALRYETEYILAGKNNDTENLRWIAERLLLIREAANAVYLYADEEKVAAVDAVAWGLAAVALEPALQPLVKHSILLSWIFAESMVDVRALFTGGNVPLLKTDDTWQLSFENMLDFTAHMDDVRENQKGLDYEMYLRLLLLMQNQNTKLLRFLDVVEMNLRRTPGNECFRMDGCIDALSVEADISGGFGEYFHISASYSYLDR